jgi:midasin (ATPase involved in ribosome maturation)
MLTYAYQHFKITSGMTSLNPNNEATSNTTSATSVSKAKKSLVKEPEQRKVRSRTKLQLKMASKPFDIYHDASPEEVLSVRSVLLGVKQQLDALLLHYPENALVNSMLQLLRRIEQQSVQDALMKFVSGVEMLFQKLHEWQSNCAAGVGHFSSLQTSYDSVEAVVRRWR